MYDVIYLCRTDAETILAALNGHTSQKNQNRQFPQGTEPAQALRQYTSGVKQQNIHKCAAKQFLFTTLKHRQIALKGNQGQSALGGSAQPNRLRQNHCAPAKEQHKYRPSPPPPIFPATLHPAKQACCKKDQRPRFPQWQTVDPMEKFRQHYFTGQRQSESLR
jgi:hypothetical protein